MKKRLLTIIFAFTAMLCCIFGLSACGKDEYKKEKDEIAFTTLLLNEDNAYTKEVSNDITEFSFVDEIKRFGNANFVVSSDKYGSQTYLTKIVPLQIGDNEFYILESVNEEVVSVYKVVIYRWPIFYTVAFDTDGGTSVESQRVEENGFAVKPAQNPTWNDFTTFTGWDFDFTTPITEDITIKADWVTSEECFTADGGTITGLSEYGKENCTVLYIPSTINGVTITEIGMSAFQSCYNLTSVVIPNSVTDIGYFAFSDCSSLTSVVIPNSVTTIEYAFEYCSSLTSIVIPNSVTRIGDRVFACCGSLTSVVIPDSVTSIGMWAFAYCSSLTSVVIPDSVTGIYWNAFAYCDSLTSVVIPDSVTSIGGYAFSNCSSLTSVVIPDSVTSIGESAFSWCSALTSVTIPDSVTSVGGFAFGKCDSLTGFAVGENNEYYKSIDGNLYSKDGKVLIQYAIGKTATSITIPDSVTSIGEGAFSGCSSLTSIVIGNSVTTIGNYAFSSCSSLTSIVIGDSVTSIGYEAFSGCCSLTSIVIPDSVTNIGNWVFEGCDRLTIYCEAESAPSGWAYNWNYSNRPVVWGYKEND